MRCWWGMCVKMRGMCGQDKKRVDIVVCLGACEHVDVRLKVGSLWYPVMVSGLLRSKCTVTWVVPPLSCPAGM